MSQNSNRIIFLLILFALPGLSMAQRTRTGNGSAQVRIEDNMTRMEARQKAEQQAKIDAISKEFGTYVEQQSELSIYSGKTDFSVIGSTRVKGEWVKTQKIEFTEETRTESGPNGLREVIWVTCNIRGAMKPASPKAAIEYEILKCQDIRCRTTTFKNKEDFFVWFRSPIEGYVSIYMDDNELVNRLLPYSRSNLNAVRVMPDQEYIFFGSQNEPVSNVSADNLTLVVSKPSEIHKVYILFSEREFPKPPVQVSVIQEDRSLRPATLSKSRFESWLSDNRALISDFRDDQVVIEIYLE
jgi:hypothetical protein